VLHPFWWWVGNIHLWTFDCLVIRGVLQLSYACLRPEEHVSLLSYHEFDGFIFQVYYSSLKQNPQSVQDGNNKMEYFMPNLFSFATSTWRLGSNHGGNKTLKQKVKETGIWTEISWRNQLSYIKIYAYGSHDFYFTWNSGQEGNRSSSQRFGDSNHRFHP
jgi:hypothetical protein